MFAMAHAMDPPVQSSHGKDKTRATRSVVVDGQLSAPLDALSDTSTSITETIPVSCANATDFFNSLLGDDLFRLECCNHISAEREACMSRRIIRGNDVEIATGAFDGRAHPSVLLVMRAPMPWWPERFCSRIPDKTAMAELVRSY